MRQKTSVIYTEISSNGWIIWLGKCFKLEMTKERSITNCYFTWNPLERVYYEGTAFPFYFPVVRHPDGTAACGLGSAMWSASRSWLSGILRWHLNKLKLIWNLFKSVQLGLPSLFLSVYRSEHQKIGWQQLVGGSFLLLGSCWPIQNHVPCHTFDMPCNWLLRYLYILIHPNFY